MAGPCAVESREQAFRIAGFVKSVGATAFRAGAFKGQNRPVVNGKKAFWGLGEEGLEILKDVQTILKIPVITEIQDNWQFDEMWRIFNGDIKYVQVGARHMQNFPLLRFLNGFEGTIILKRGLGNTTDEWIGAAEHLGGPDKVILCERGVVSFDRTPNIRWRLDFVAAAYIKTYHPEYKLIIDPSHGSGDRNLVYSLSRAALEIADGLMVEVHYSPDESPTDARQTIDFNVFKEIAGCYERYKKRS